MLKVYIDSTGFKMIGKAKDICNKLKEYQQQFEKVNDLLQNSNKPTQTSSFTLRHDQDSFTVVTTQKKTPKHINYYLLFPRKK